MSAFSSSSLILFQTTAANFIFAVDSTPALESLNFFFVELFTVVFSDVSVADVGGIDIYVFVCIQMLKEQNKTIKVCVFADIRAIHDHFCHKFKRCSK